MKTIFICTIPRTGSSLLAADMRSTAAMGEPREYFNPNRRSRLTEKWSIPAGDLDRYIGEIRNRTGTENGVVAVKLMARHVLALGKIGELDAGGAGLLRQLTDRFGEAVLVSLLRRDKLRQAISLTKAKQTGKWGVLREATSAPFYDPHAISASIVEIVQREALWRRELDASAMKPALSLIYEDLPDSRDEVLLQIARLLALPDPEGVVASRDLDEVKLERQADAVSEEWYQRFLDEPTMTAFVPGQSTGD